MGFGKPYVCDCGREYQFRDDMAACKRREHWPPRTLKEKIGQSVIDRQANYFKPKRPKVVSIVQRKKKPER